ncbi:Hypothetical protein DEACI_3098 [Acididesulfobacillus acetoxydans]|uniref:Uncharacterized protein n=1 Tax=Acididesulfobacillus acetoxydans TaxID=1561005 RepID=A0A8S0WQ66_9FIRM|nr:Hypothetical protein DEACI_3098 [Acididesulfobacillus acetoxydans]CEJ08341.1 Hypothetical protein DEACI_2817 [Acididesulfobacillus acetoxydans]
MAYATYYSSEFWSYVNDVFKQRPEDKIIFRRYE